MMTNNPLGTDGFEFVEFTGPQPEQLASSFTQLGFTEVGHHRRKRVTHYRQGGINFILNAEPGGMAQEFGRRHGPSANAMAFRVADARFAFEEAVRRGAQPALEPAGPMELSIPAIQGVDGILIYLVDRYGAQSIYDVDFKPTGQQPASDTCLLEIDHLTHNLRRGNLEKWAEFYERVFDFREIRRFDIEGKVTGLVSKAMTSPCGKIRIPLNESKDDSSQIEEFLERYNGEGIQHIALASGDIYRSVAELNRNSVPFQDTPDTYYDALPARIPDHGEDLSKLRDLGILVDGDRDAEGLLLQIFTKDAIGPIFFEIIQRKGNEGFGEGNFQALFESIELDQMRRGVIGSET